MFQRYCINYYNRNLINDINIEYDINKDNYKPSDLYSKSVDQLKSIISSLEIDIKTKSINDNEEKQNSIISRNIKEKMY